jgi:hypothetical protein
MLFCHVQMWTDNNYLDSGACCLERIISHLALDEASACITIINTYGVVMQSIGIVSNHDFHRGRILLIGL